ncbi:MAG TPA: 1-(5-phosphoribosyl)-5-[(5-phosphoribosylamino)methylideneamino]imidazole-4-carboxamide isomerase [Candidatus Binatia bacterium]|jgi:phosphoribosylformimino-5-aminoimidazole carboxamide ribotide isomerase
MIVIPAIDLKDGRCVRLFQGDMDKETVYFADPLDAARHWAAEGAELLHVVDLNGAVEGRPVHTREIAAMCGKISIPIELGGGLRSLAAVGDAFALGVARAIVGTAAYDNPEFLREACQKFPGKIVVGIDARGGKVAVKGWKETTALDAVELARRVEGDGASRIIYTDIARDGTREGVNIDETRRVAQAVNIPVIASGGVATLDDIRRLKAIEKDGVEGVIVGRALYTGGVKMKDAALLGAL